MRIQESFIEFVGRAGGVVLLGGIVLFFAWPRSKHLERYLGDNEGLLFSQREISPSEVVYLQARPLPKTAVTELNINNTASSTPRTQPAYFVFGSGFRESVNHHQTAVQDPVVIEEPIVSAQNAVGGGNTFQCSAHATSPISGPAAPECSAENRGAEGEEVKCSTIWSGQCST